MTAELTKLRSQTLIAEIRSIDPSYRFDSLGFPESFDGQMNQLNDLQLDRARVYYVMRGDARPLQVETLRFLQSRTDAAYVDGLQALKDGKLKIRLSPAEAVGNYIDRRVRDDLRGLYSFLKIPTVRGERVRINSREYDSSGSDRTYRQPDARIDDVAFDVTLTLKTGSTGQVRGFFGSDFKPRSVVIVRPSQLGQGSTYIITNPGN